MTEDKKQAKMRKPRLFSGLLQRFPLAAKMVAELSRYGSLKYGVKPHEIAEHIVGDDKYGHLTESLFRHLSEEAEGRVHNHDDGGMLHAANVAWNALARLQVYLEQHPEEMGWSAEDAWSAMNGETVCNPAFTDAVGKALEAARAETERKLKLRNNNAI